MGKTFKNFRNDLREDSTRGRPKTATRLEKAIEKYKKSIYNMQEDLDDDDMASLEQYVNEMESEPDSLTESDLEDEPVEQEKITVFKLNISNEDANAQDDINDDDIDDLASELSTSDLEEEKPVLDVSDLKTISINLEESTEKIDYKKLQLPKLKSIVVEKKLATSSDASKLKKAELLKLLGVE